MDTASIAKQRLVVVFRRSLFGSGGFLASDRNCVHIFGKHEDVSCFFQVDVIEPTALEVAVQKELVCCYIEGCLGKISIACGLKTQNHASLFKRRLW